MPNSITCPLFSDLHASIQSVEELETADLLIMFSLLTDFEVEKNKDFGDLTVNELNAFLVFFLQQLAAR